MTGNDQDSRDHAERISNKTVEDGRGGARPDGARIEDTKRAGAALRRHQVGH